MTKSGEFSGQEATTTYSKYLDMATLEAKNVEQKVATSK